MKTILLADDSITIQKVVELTFSEGDYQVICVSNGTQALNKIREVRPDVILLDIIMPEKNGYEVCEEIKADPSTARIPVLLLTGTFEPFDEKRADAVGAVGHLTKPFESHALVSRVDELVGSGSPAAGPMASAGVAAPPAASVPNPPATATESLADAFEIEPPQAPPPAMAAPSPYSDHGSADRSPLAPGLGSSDPTAGGSFQSASPLDLEAHDDAVIPDRYDDPAPPATATVRLNRDQILAGVGPEAEPASPPGRSATTEPEPMDGFVTGYELPGSAPAGPLASPPPVPLSTVRGGGDDDRVSAMTPEVIDRIAEQVVQRMSDRAVREIAWEIIPRVAEVIVRGRIKELEDQGEG